MTSTLRFSKARPLLADFRLIPTPSLDFQVALNHGDTAPLRRKRVLSRRIYILTLTLTCDISFHYHCIHCYYRHLASTACRTALTHGHLGNCAHSAYPLAGTDLTAGLWERWQTSRITITIRKLLRYFFTFVFNLNTAVLCFELNN